MDLIWGKREAKYFFRQDWTASISLIRFNKFAVRRRVLKRAERPRPPLKVDQFRGLTNGYRFDAGLIRNIGGKKHTRSLHDGRMNLQKNSVCYPPFLSSYKFHRMIAAKAKMHVIVHTLEGVSFVAPIISARRRCCWRMAIATLPK